MFVHSAYRIIIIIIIRIIGKFQGNHISTELSWTVNTLHLMKKAPQLLFFLRKLKRTGAC